MVPATARPVAVQPPVAGLAELISLVQQRLAAPARIGGVRLCDGTLISVANYPGCQRRSEFAGFARYGFVKSQHRYV